MTFDEMILALEDGPMSLGSDDDYVLVPVATANKIAAALKAGEEMFGATTDWDFEAARDAWYVATKDDALEEYSKLSQEIGEDV